jgi:hypothetical protein
MAEITEIKIKVDGDEIYCTRKRHPGGDSVRWLCNHPFTVDFGVASPLDHKSSEYGVEEAPDDYKTAWVEADADDKKQGSPIVFKYTVAVWANDKVLIEDPEIIIDP